MGDWGGGGGAAEEEGGGDRANLVAVPVAELREASTMGGPASDCWFGSAGEGGDEWEVPIASTSIGVDWSLGVADTDKLDRAGARGDQKTPSFGRAWS